MREEIMSPSNAPARIGRFRDTQIAQRSTWAGVRDDQTALAAMHVVHVVPANGSTITVLNPCDPGTLPDANTPDEEIAGMGWLRRQGAPGTLWAAG